MHVLYTGTGTGDTMARIVGRLKGRQVANAKPKRGKDWALIPDGGNLYLQVTRGKEDHIARGWTFKYELAGRRREMGLGPVHTVSLAEARAKARDLRQQLLEGIDPLEARQKVRQVLLAERARTVTFKQVAEMYLDLHLDSFQNAKHQQQWKNTLGTYVYPKIGSLAVADVDPPSYFSISFSRCGKRKRKRRRAFGVASSVSSTTRPRPVSDQVTTRPLTSRSPCQSNPRSRRSGITLPCPMPSCPHS